MRTDWNRVIAEITATGTSKDAYGNIVTDIN